MWSRSCSHLKGDGEQGWWQSPSWGRTRLHPSLSSSPAPISAHRDPSAYSKGGRNMTRVPQVSLTDYSFTSQGQGWMQGRKAAHSPQMELAWTRCSARADWANLKHAATSNYLPDKKTHLQKAFSWSDFRRVFFPCCLLKMNTHNTNYLINFNK